MGRSTSRPYNDYRREHYLEFGTHHWSDGRFRHWDDYSLHLLVHEWMQELICLSKQREKQNKTLDQLLKDAWQPTSCIGYYSHSSPPWIGNLVHLTAITT